MQDLTYGSEVALVRGVQLATQNLRASAQSIRPGSERAFNRVLGFPKRTLHDTYRFSRRVVLGVDYA